MKLCVSTIVLLSCAVSSAVVAEISDESSLHRTATRQLVEDFEAKLPRLPAWQRARGLHSQVGPPRHSLESRADAIASTQRVLEGHNQLHSKGGASFFLSWNPLSDLSDAEYREFLKARVDNDAHPKSRGLHSVYTQLEHHHDKKSRSVGFQDANKWTPGRVQEANTTETTPLPVNWNWLEIEGGKYITPIKNQGSCGSCWAFSAVSVIESRYAIDNKVAATPLSVEQVLSCSAPLDHIRSKFKDMVSSSKGCEGGMPFLAFEYMSRVAPSGIACASDYPYVMATRVLETQCQSVPDNEVAVSWKNGESDYETVESQNEEALLRAVYQGPVSSNIDALGDGFRHYGGGIYDASDCASDGKEVNHAVVIVGYGETEQGEKYWVVRNTWGTMWGENGYIRIARGKSASSQPYGPCNMYLYSSYPVKLAKGTSNDDGVCPAVTTAFTKLGWAKLMAVDGMHTAMILGLTIVCVAAGVAFFIVTEQVHKRKDAAGQTTYEDNFKRWILPTKSQIAAMLARRRPQEESV